MNARITLLGHATVKLTLPDGRVLIIDPWLTDNPACPDELKTPDRCDMILLTHGHADHVGDVERLVKAHDPWVVANIELCAAFQKRTGGGRYSGMNTGGTQTIDGVRISLTQACHSSGVDFGDGMIYGGMPNGLVVGFEGLAPLYHAGDTDVFSDMQLIARLFAPKIALLPIGDHFTMGAKGAALAAEMLGANSIIPIHYKTFPVLAQSADAFVDALLVPLRSTVIVPEVGQELGWTFEGVAV